MLEPDRAEYEYKLRLEFERPAPDRVSALADAPLAAVSDALNKRNTLPPHIEPAYAPVERVVGPAFTVHVTPGDELLALKAIHEAETGDVIVIAGAWSPRFSVWGGIMSIMAANQGIAGLVTDGLVRDIDECRQAGFPIFCAGTTPHAPCMDVPPGEINYPVSIEGTPVHPGDLVLADREGVVVAPRALLGGVAEAVQNRLEREQQWLKQVADGDLILEQTVEDILAGRQCYYADGDSGEGR